MAALVAVIRWLDVLVEQIENGALSARVVAENGAALGALITELVLHGCAAPAAHSRELEYVFCFVATRTGVKRVAEPTFHIAVAVMVGAG